MAARVRFASHTLTPCRSVPLSLSAFLSRAGRGGGGAHSCGVSPGRHREAVRQGQDLRGGACRHALQRQRQDAGAAGWAQCERQPCLLVSRLRWRLRVQGGVKKHKAADCALCRRRPPIRFGPYCLPRLRPRPPPPLSRRLRS